ncbi:MAG: hypothetical protein EHM53_03405 [Methanoregulaceae archaeon]|nr:MAG: hypothetical protein EHM53_03405 [Methanoregulaceae archaeon]
MIGIAHVMHAAGVLNPPTGAAGCDRSCTVGCRSAFSPAGTTVTPYSPHWRDPLWQHTTRPSQSHLRKRATYSTNDDHFMHIPHISAHRNVNNCSS